MAEDPGLAGIGERGTGTAVGDCVGRVVVA